MKKMTLTILVIMSLNWLGCQDDDDTVMTDPLYSLFDSDRRVIPKGDQITFTDMSEGDPLEWYWLFEGGTPSSSVEQSPIIYYEHVGTYDVTLIVKNKSNSDTLLQEGYITVEEQLAPANYNVDSNIIYGINHQKHVLDLYYPKDLDTKTPLIIMLGGGEFIFGSNRNYLAPFAEIFASKGIAVASARYRNVEVEVEGQISRPEYLEGMIKCNQDAKAAVRFFRANAEQYNIDERLIFIGGNSSGAIGSLVAGYYSWDEMGAEEKHLYNLHGGIDGTQGNIQYSSAVCGVVSMSGSLFQGNVLTLIDEDDPAFFGVCAMDDTNIPCGIYDNGSGYYSYGAEAIAEKTQAAGLPTGTYFFPSGGHDISRLRPQDYKEELLAWIQPILKNPPSFNPDPLFYYETFDASCGQGGLPPGWQSTSVANQAYNWSCHDSESGVIIINSFSETGQDHPTENWLTSPTIKLPNSTALSLRFDYSLRYLDNAGYGLRAYISESTIETFDASEWTPITPLFEQQTVREYTKDFRCAYADISDYANQDIRFAIRYTSSGSVKDKSFQARFDNLRIKEE